MGQHSLYSRIVTLYRLTLSKRLRGRATGGGGGLQGHIIQFLRVNQVSH